MDSTMPDTLQVAEAEHRTETLELVADILTSVIENIFKIQLRGNESMIQSDSGVGNAIISPPPEKITDIKLELPDENLDTARSGPEDGKENMDISAGDSNKGEKGILVNNDPNSNCVGSANTTCSTFHDEDSKMEAKCGLELKRKNETICRENDFKRDKRERVQFGSPLAVYHEYTVSQTSCSQSTQSISDDDSDSSEDVQQKELSHTISSDFSRSDQMVEINVTCPESQQGQGEGVCSIQDECMTKFQSVSDNIKVSINGGEDLIEHADNICLSNHEVKSSNHTHSQEQQDLTNKFADNGNLNDESDSFHKEIENDDADMVTAHLSDIKTEEKRNCDDPHTCKSALMEIKVPSNAEDALDMKCRKDESYFSGGQKQYVSDFIGETFTSIPMHASVTEDHINDSPDLFCEPAFSEEYPDNSSVIDQSNQDIKEVLTEIVTTITRENNRAESFHSSNKISLGQKESVENNEDTIPVEATIEEQEKKELSAVEMDMASIDSEAVDDIKCPVNVNKTILNMNLNITSKENDVTDYSSSASIAFPTEDKINSVTKKESKQAVNNQPVFMTNDAKINAIIDVKQDELCATALSSPEDNKSDEDLFCSDEHSNKVEAALSSPEDNKSDEELFCSDEHSNNVVNTALLSPEDNKSDEDLFCSDEHLNKVNAALSSPDNVKSDEDLFCSDEYSSKINTPKTREAVKIQVEDMQRVVDASQTFYRSEEMAKIQCSPDVSNVKEMVSNTNLNVVHNENEPKSIVHQNTFGTLSEIHKDPKVDTVYESGTSSSASILYPSEDVICTDGVVISDELKERSFNQTVNGSKDGKLNAIDMIQDDLHVTAMSSSPEVTNSAEDQSCGGEQPSKEGSNKTEAVFGEQGKNLQSAVEMDQTANDLEEVSNLICLVQVKEARADGTSNVEPKELDTKPVIMCENICEIPNEPKMDVVDESHKYTDNGNNYHCAQMPPHAVDKPCTGAVSHNNERDTIQKRKPCSPLINASFAKKLKQSKDTDNVVSTDDINPLKRKQTFRFSEDHSCLLKSKCSTSCNSIFGNESSGINPKALKCLATETLDTMSEEALWEVNSKSSGISDTMAMEQNITAEERITTSEKSSQSEFHSADKERYHTDADEISDGRDKNASDKTLRSTRMQNDNDFNCSPCFITATEYLSQGSSAGFSPCMATNAETLCASQEEELVIVNEHLLLVSQHPHEAKHVYEITEDGITAEEVPKTFNSLSTGANILPANTAEERADENLEEQLDIDQLDELVDKAVDQMVPDDCKDDMQSDFDQGESLYTPKKEDKPPGKPDGCFKWKYVPSCDLDSPLDLPTLEDEDQVRITPLKTCEKPIRLGLSRRQPVHRLHKLGKL